MQKFSLFCKYFIFYVFFILISYIVFANVNKGSRLSSVSFFLFTVLTTTTIFIFSVYKKQFNLKQMFFSVVTKKKMADCHCCCGICAETSSSSFGFCVDVGRRCGRLCRAFQWLSAIGV